MRKIVALLAICMIGGYVNVVAKADVTIEQTTVIDCPGMKQMLKDIPSNQRAPLLKMLSPMLTGTPWVTYTYLKGSRMRTDMGETSVLVNTTSEKQATLDNQTHVYSIGPYDPFQKAAGTFTFHVSPTAGTENYLGHPSQHYIISMTSSVMPNGVIGGEMWSAIDLPAPPSAGYTSGQALGFQNEMAKVKGMPLAYKLTYANTPAGTITVTSYASKINTNPIIMSEFTIPAGYKQGTTRMPTTTPSTGFPLGDGMPLDSMSAVTDAMATGEGGSSNASSIAQLLGGSGGGDISKLLGGLSSSGESSTSGAASQLGDTSAALKALAQSLSSQIDSLTGDQ